MHPRPFVFNLGTSDFPKLVIVNSLFPKEFGEFIGNVFNNREKVFINKKWLKVLAKSEFTKLFKQHKVESSNCFE